MLPDATRLIRDTVLRKPPATGPRASRGWRRCSTPVGHRGDRRECFRRLRRRAGGVRSVAPLALAPESGSDRRRLPGGIAGAVSGRQRVDGPDSARVRADAVLAPDAARAADRRRLLGRRPAAAGTRRTPVAYAGAGWSRRQLLLLGPGADS